MPDYWDEAALRGGGQTGGYVADTTPINTQFTYNNGMHYAGTNVPISDQALELMRTNQNGIATDADVSGTGGVGNSLGNAAKFELDHVGNILEGLTDPTRIFGIDPLTTKFGNAVFGTNNDPLVNQMGGATSQQIADYEREHGLNSAGGAQGLHNAAAGTAGIVAAGTLAHGGFGGGQGYSGPMTPYQGNFNGNWATETLGMPAAEAGGAAGGAAGAAGAGLPEIVVTGTIPGGISGAGLGAAGGLLGAAGTIGSGGPAPTDYGDMGGWQPNSDPVGEVSQGIGSGSDAGDLVLAGGAGTIAVPGWLSTVADTVGGLVGGGGGGLLGGGGGGSPVPSSGFMGSGPVASTMSGSAARQRQGLNQQVTRLKGYSRTPIDFRGSTIWV